MLNGTTLTDIAIDMLCITALNMHNQFSKSDMVRLTKIIPAIQQGTDPATYPRAKDIIDHLEKKYGVK